MSRLASPTVLIAAQLRALLLPRLNLMIEQLLIDFRHRPSSTALRALQRAVRSRQRFIEACTRTRVVVPPTPLEQLQAELARRQQQKHAETRHD